MKIVNPNGIKSPIQGQNNLKTNNVDFRDFLLNSIDKIKTYEKEANELGLLLASGEIDNVHDVMIANQKAEIALQFGIEVKNQLMEAYKEIMRIQL